MKYYTIDNFSYQLCSLGITDSKSFYNARKANLKTTSIFWVCYEVEIDPYYIDATYEKKFPILIFLN